MVAVATNSSTRMLYDPNDGGAGGGGQRTQPAAQPQPQPQLQPQPPPSASGSAVTETQSGAIQPVPTTRTAADTRDRWANDAATTYRMSQIQSSLPASGATNTSDGSSNSTWVPGWVQDGATAIRNGASTVATAAGNAGRTVVDGAVGVLDGAISPNPTGPIFGNQTAYDVGRVTGASAGLVADASLVAEGIGMATGGTAVSGTGVGALVGVPAVAAGGVVATAGVAGATVHSQRFADAAGNLLQSSAGGASADSGAPSGRRLVIGGGDAEGYPRLGNADVALNIDPAARPDVIANGNRLPIADRTMSNVTVENLRTADFMGRGMVDESYRVLEPGGTIRVQTGGGMGSTERAAEVNQVVDEMRNAGFRDINVWRDYGSTGLPTDFRYVIEAIK
jgi:hypothetical protein